jgi:alpha-L-fucosidase 2
VANASRISRPIARLAVAAAAIIVVEHAATAAPDLALWYAKPANPKVWEEALPVGSGRLGAMVFGGVADERVQFNEDTLWTGKPHDYDRDGAGRSLAEIRDLVFAGKAEDAGKALRAHFLSDPVRQKAYQPFGDLRLHLADPGTVSDYRRDLDLGTAIASVSYSAGGVKYRREVFASYPENVIVVHLTADRPGQVAFTLQMTSPHKDSATQVSGDHELVLAGQVHDPTAGNEAGERFQSVVDVSADGGSVHPDAGGISVEGANGATLVLAAATSFNTFQDISGDPAARSEAILANVRSKSYDALRAEHVADHQALFGRVSLDLGHGSRDDLPTDERIRQINAAAGGGGNPKKAAAAPASLPEAGLASDPALAALLFQYGRYLLISSSRPGSQPANLQGVWNELLSPPWESKYTTNINVEMNYWPAEVANLGECHLPLFDMIHDLTVSGARTADALYHARGWVLHHNTDIWRGTAPINNVDGVWPTGGAWLCTHEWEHYLFTGDRDFLSRVYPDLRGASLFFLDSLVKDPNTGFMVTNPSFSPEQGTTCAGPAMDMQLIRALFDETSEAATLLGQDGNLVRQISEMRRQLAPDRVEPGGNLAEWQDEQPWSRALDDKQPNLHRHMSPLWGLYPGAQFTPYTPELYQAAKTLLVDRGDGSTGWSYAWRIPLWARVHDGDDAFRQLDLLMARRMFPNLFDKCGPFQIDGNFGATAGIAEMLLQSQWTTPGEPPVREVDVLPALPHAWPEGSVTNLCARDGFEVSFAWSGGTLRHVTVHSKLGRPCELVYGTAERALDTKPGEKYAFDGRLEPVQ